MEHGTCSSSVPPKHYLRVLHQYSRVRWWEGEQTGSTEGAFEGWVLMDKWRAF